MYNITYRRKYYYAFSSIILLAGLMAWLFFGLKLGIDFTGGSLIELSIPSETTTQHIKEKIEQSGFTVNTIQLFGENQVQVKLKELNAEEHAALSEAIIAELPGVSELGFSTIGPTIGNEVKQKAVTATILVFGFIVVYISWSFRKSTYGPVTSWVWGVSAIIALFHDLLVVLGVFAILGKFAGAEIDVMFITALLTVLGFSVHDTIVVFDRVREQLRSQGAKETFEDVVNRSVNQTLVRSLGTSLTTMLVLVALLLFGGTSIQYFVIALLVGMAIGTYSSIFIASPLLVTWYRFKTR